jgi:hypothetical protein
VRAKRFKDVEERRRCTGSDLDMVLVMAAEEFTEGGHRRAADARQYGVWMSREWKSERMKLVRLEELVLAARLHL